MKSDAWRVLFLLTAVQWLRLVWDVPFKFDTKATSCYDASIPTVLKREQIRNDSECIRDLIERGPIEM